MKPISLLVSSAIALFASSTHAETRVFNWNITWTSANPSGVQERQVIGINGVWPLPRVEINKGDRVIANVYNALPDRNTSIHFHGMYQNGTSYMDGPSLVTQCPIPPGASFTYNFTADQNGTYWYHAHVPGQYPDGYRAPFIIHDEDAYFAKDFDEELVWTFSDWYNDLMDTLRPEFLNLYNPSGAEPVPNNIIFNESQNVSVAVKPNTTYLIHLMNIGALGSIYFYVEDHNFTVVEVDGVYVEPHDAQYLYLAVAQRYSILLTTKDTTDKNYGIVAAFDQGLFDVIEPWLELNQTNWLEYNSSAAHDHVYPAFDSSDDIPALDDFELVPADGHGLYPDPDVEITVDVSMNNLLNGVNYAFFNNITYTAPKVPTLYTVMSAPEEDLMNPSIYGEFTHSFVYQHNQVVQIVVNSNDPGTHPFHMHGHEFQVIQRSQAYDDDSPTAFDPDNHDPFPAVPMRRDTAHVRPNGNMVLRFRADNPGVWFFHCHIEWHLEQGLALLLVEAPDKIRENQVIPQGHLDVCAAAGVSSTGNAAANTQDYTDLTGQNRQVPDLPSGFTARGIVALVFSCVSAFLGMFVIAWYGMSDLSNSESKIVEILEEDEALTEATRHNEEVQEEFYRQHPELRPPEHHLHHPHLHHREHGQEVAAEGGAVAAAAAPQLEPK